MSAPQTTVTLAQEDYEALQRVLKLADQLCTEVISGSTGMRNKAFDFARAYNDLKKRRKIVTNL